MNCLKCATAILFSFGYSLFRAIVIGKCLNTTLHERFFTVTWLACCNLVYCSVAHLAWAQFCECTVKCGDYMRFTRQSLSRYTLSGPCHSEVCSHTTWIGDVVKNGVEWKYSLNVMLLRHVCFFTNWKLQGYVMELGSFMKATYSIHPPKSHGQTLLGFLRKCFSKFYSHLCACLWVCVCLSRSKLISFPQIIVKSGILKSHYYYFTSCSVILISVFTQVAIGKSWVIGIGEIPLSIDVNHKYDTKSFSFVW